LTASDFARVLAEGGVDERRTALGSLSLEPSGERASLLVRALGDAEWRVRKEAVRVAVANADDNLIALLIDAIVEPETVGQRNSALEVLGLLGARSSRALRSAYATVEVGARKFVVLALGETGDVGITDVLLDAVSHEDPNLVASAIDALARLGGTDAEAALVALLTSDDPFQRMAALDGLDRLRARVPFAALEAVIKDPLVRPVALPVLGRSGSIHAVAPLVEALDGDAAPTVASAAQGLVDLYEESDDLAHHVDRVVRTLTPGARAALARLLEDGERSARGAAATLLVLARDRASISAVMALGADGLLPSSTLTALSSWGIDAVPALLEVFEASHGGVRACALETAAGLAVDAPATAKLDEAVEASLRQGVLHALTDSDEHVRRSAARSLSWWASPADAQVLVDLVCASDDDVSLACGQALEHIASTSPSAVAEALADREIAGPGAAALVGVVAKLGGHEAVARLSSVMSAREPAVRRAAIAALSTLDESGTVELLALALADENADVRAAAARALGRAGTRANVALCVDALLLALDGDEPRVRAEVAEALGRLRIEAARAPLAELVRGDGDANVVLSALSALGCFASSALDAPIARAVTHPDEEVVKTALRLGVEARLASVRPLVERALAHPAWDVRIAAAQDLASYADAAAVERLRERAEYETDAMVARAIREAIAIAEGAD
jgi:HEAT repeat protein